jgi:Domain of unknown function (DUF397)
VSSIMPAAEVLSWRKASYSDGNGECVEVAIRAGDVAIRDSKYPDGHVLNCSPSGWAAFLVQVKS